MWSVGPYFLGNIEQWLELKCQSHDIIILLIGKKFLDGDHILDFADLDSNPV